ncbi:MAG TPA: hypothetical protein VFA30_03665 [Gaiellaceae bacterium]|nr:hypothetical protein [Gaiellaceae bacterium]
MASLRAARPYSALDLPHPWRAGLAFAALAAAALSLEADPRLPWAVGVAAALLFVAAGAARTVQGRSELAAVRRTADTLIVTAPTSRDASELVRWRCAELTTRESRDRLAREVGRTLAALDPRRLPSASPLRRPEARAAADLLQVLEGRLGDEQPIAARGILLARMLLRDPASPLYSEGPEQNLSRALRRVLGALEP